MTTTQLARICLIALVIVGCELNPTPRPTPGAVDLTRPLTHEFVDQEPTVPTRELSAKEEEALARYNQLLDDFESRSERAWDTEGTVKHLSGLERFYIDTGRLFTLMRMYREVYDERGPGHFVGPRLAWTYVLLGEDELALEVLTACEKARPKDPMIYFIRGSIIGQQDSPSLSDMAAVRDYWYHALELDPQFSGPLGINAKVLRARLVEMDKLIARSGGPPRKKLGTKDQSPTPEPGPDSATTDETKAPDGVVKGEELLAVGKYLEALASFQNVLEEDRGNRRAQVGYAIAAWRAEGSRDEVRARRMLEFVSNRTDLEPRELYELGTVWFKQVGEPKKAIDLWERASKKDPEFAERQQLDKAIEQARTTTAP